MRGPRPWLRPRAGGRDAGRAVDGRLACDVALIPTSALFGLAACGNGNGDMRDALDEAFHTGCGLDVEWVDRGPLSYDTDYPVAVAC